MVYQRAASVQKPPKVHEVTVHHNISVRTMSAKKPEREVAGRPEIGTGHAGCGEGPAAREAVQPFSPKMIVSRVLNRSIAGCSQQPLMPPPSGTAAGRHHRSHSSLLLSGVCCRRVQVGVHATVQVCGQVVAPSFQGSLKRHLRRQARGQARGRRRHGLDAACGARGRCYRPPREQPVQHWRPCIRSRAELS
jgi:hypothetical protein